MYSQGDYVSYGVQGVCQVQGITEMNLPGSKIKKQFYVLVPVYDDQGTIYSPVEEGKVSKRRPILTQQEANELISSIPSVGLIDAADRKEFDLKVKEAASSGECMQWVVVMKTLISERDARIAAGKKMTTTNERLLKSAGDKLSGELAISLKIDRSMVVDILRQKLEGE